MDVGACTERLLAAGGAIRPTCHNTRAGIVVIFAGRTFRVSIREGSPVWRGRPALQGVLVDTRRGTLVVGRLVPDPFALTAAVVALWIGGVFLAALAFGRDGTLSRLAAFYVATTSGFWPLAAAVALVAAGLARARGWQRQCLTILGVVTDACPAREPGPPNPDLALPPASG